MIEPLLVDRPDCCLNALIHNFPSSTRPHAALAADLETSTQVSTIVFNCRGIFQKAGCCQEEGEVL